MTPSVRTIHIAAALIDDDAGRLLLVRKTGTECFMQAGGKIEPGESASTALRRELNEELTISVSEDDLRYLGRFSSPAAHEPDHMVVADLFHVTLRHHPDARPGAEIEDIVWVGHVEAAAMRLAPLTRDHVLALALAL